MEPRPNYSPSGRVNVAALGLDALVLCAGAGLTAVVLALLATDSCDYGWFFWFVPALALLAAGRPAVRRAHCRNTVVALALVASAGLLAVAGGLHLDQCRRWGVEWHRVDRLPGYVTFRMETDRWQMHLGHLATRPLDAGANPEVVPHLEPRVRPNSHWLALALEVLVLAALPALYAAPAARRPYSERLRGWYRFDAVPLTRASSAALKAALRAGAVAGWVERDWATTGRREDQYPLTVWYCPRPADGADFEPTVYLARYAARPARLTPEEVAALVPVFPSLVEWAAVPVEERPASLTQTPPPRDPATAAYSRVPPPHHGRCKELSAVRGRQLQAQWATLAIMARGLGLVVATTGGLVGLLNALGASQFVLICAFFVVISVLLSPAGLDRLQRDEAPRFTAEAKHVRRTLTDQARLRTDALFDPDTPGVVTLEVVPRRLWAGRELGADAVEPGLLLVDVGSRRVLFEGDRHRWTVPFAAVTGYGAEVVELACQDEYPLVLFAFDTDDGPKELPLLVRTGLPGANRYDFADALRTLLYESIAPLPAVPAGGVA